MECFHGSSRGPLANTRWLPDLLDWPEIAYGKSRSCSAGTGACGYFGFAWWQDDADYEASIWDLTADCRIDGFESSVPTR